MCYNSTRLPAWHNDLNTALNRTASFPKTFSLAQSWHHLLPTASKLPGSRGCKQKGNAATTHCHLLFASSMPRGREARKSFLTRKLITSDYHSKHCYNPFFPQEKYLKILITPYARLNANPKCRQGRKTLEC